MTQKIAMLPTISRRLEESCMASRELYGGRCPDNIHQDLTKPILRCILSATANRASFRIHCRCPPFSGCPSDAFLLLKIPGIEFLISRGSSPLISRSTLTKMRPACGEKKTNFSASRSVVTIKGIAVLMREVRRPSLPMSRANFPKKIQQAVRVTPPQSSGQMLWVSI